MRKNKTKLLIILLLLPTIMSLGSFITNARAGPDIPEDNPNNSWHWGVDEGDMLILETEIIATNFGTGGVTMMRNFDIFNITSIINETGDTMSLYPNQEFSKVMVDQLWEDSVGDLSPSPLVNNPLASFGYNDTLSKEFYQPMAYSLAPMILPLNDTVVDVSLMASILNETYINPMGEQGFFNKFDNYTYNVGKTEMTFRNTTDNYYFRASYYPNNGTIKDMDAYYLVWMGAWASANVTGKRVFEFDGTDEVVWGVSPGETYYYYENQSGNAFLRRLEVQGFNKAVYWSKNWTAYNTLWPMVFEEAILSISDWNGTGWQPYMTSMPLTAANNFYPMCFPLMESLGMDSGNILPISATVEDFLFMINNHTADLTKWYPMDTIHYEDSGGILNVTMSQSGNGYLVKGIYNFNTGFVELNYATYLGDIIMWSEKADEFVEWDVGIGDYLYVTMNFGDSLTNKRAIIKSINYTFIDVTTLGVSIPPGQPKFQFFTELHAEFSQWMPHTEVWNTYATAPLSAANEYWPIAPYMMDNIPYLMPKGTAATDLQYLYDTMASIYDNITYSPGHIILRNTTANKELNMIFNETTGKVKYYGGPYYHMGDWTHLSCYPEFIQNLNTGTNNFVLSDNYDMDPTVTVSIDVQVGGTTPDFIYALLPYNPIGASLPNGNALFYLDHKLTNHTVIDGNITMTVQFPSSIDLRIDPIYLWTCNVSGTSPWISIPQEVIDTMIYNYGSNSITIEFPITAPYYQLYAVSFDYGPPSSPTLSSDAGVPTDDDGDFTLTWDASDGAVSYSVYRYSSYITEYNSSLVTVATGITSLSLPLTGYSNGTYYFIVEAHNAYGDTLSNCIEVVVEIPPEDGDGNGDGDGDGDDAIPGYPLYLLLTFFVLIMSIIIKKKGRKIT